MDEGRLLSQLKLDIFWFQLSAPRHFPGLAHLVRWSLAVRTVLRLFDVDIGQQCRAYHAKDSGETMSLSSMPQRSAPYFLPVNIQSAPIVAYPYLACSGRILCSHERTTEGLDCRSGCKHLELEFVMQRSTVFHLYSCCILLLPLRIHRECIASQ